MTEYIVSSGIVSSGIVLDSSDRMVVLNGGKAIATTVNRDGEFIIRSGGIASDMLVAAGGGGFVTSGGTACNTTVSGGGFLTIRSGGIADGIVSDAESHIQWEAPSGGQHTDAASGRNPSASASTGSFRYADTHAQHIADSSIPGRPGRENAAAAYLVSDLTECRTTDHFRINATIKNMDPYQSESDRLQVVSLIYAINTNGKSLSSVFHDLAHELNSSGQFVYWARIVKKLNKFGYYLELVGDTDVAGLAKDIVDAEIDGFGYPYPYLNISSMNRFFQDRRIYSVKQEDIVHIISFLYSVVTKKAIDKNELESLLRGTISSEGTTGQFGYYHRAIGWLDRHGYRIAVRKRR